MRSRTSKGASAGSSGSVGDAAAAGRRRGMRLGVNWAPWARPMQPLAASLVVAWEGQKRKKKTNQKKETKQTENIEENKENNNNWVG
jgi:hypothetical protein